MHDQQILLGSLQLGTGKNIDALAALVFQRIDEALPLDAGHVEHIQLGNDRLQTGDLHIPHAMLLHELTEVFGDGQLGGSDEVELDVLELFQCLDEGVDGASVFQVTAETDGKPVHTAAQLGDGGQIGEGLGGMHMSAVARIDDRDFGIEGSGFGGALPGVAHDDDVAVGGDHLDGILQRFALGGGGGVGVGEAEQRAAQTEHGGLEGEVGAGGGLKEEGSGDFSAAGVHEVLRTVYNLAGSGVQSIPLLAGQITKIDQMAHGMFSSHFTVWI